MALIEEITSEFWQRIHRLAMKAAENDEAEFSRVQTLLPKQFVRGCRDLDLEGQI